jgi:hypothetical protein
MKKLLLLLSAFLFFTTCEKDTASDLIPNINIQENGNPGLRMPAPKIDVCHNGHIININLNAVPAHQAHGDAVDMDGDGYFDQENVCSEGVDCDDTDETIYFGCCPFTAADLEALVDMEILQQIIIISSPNSTCDPSDIDPCCHIDENGEFLITRYWIVDFNAGLHYYFDIPTGDYPPETEDNSNCLEILREEAVKRGIEFPEPIICD